MLINRQSGFAPLIIQIPLDPRLGDFGFFRHAKSPFADDVLLDLRGTAPDDQTQVIHVLVLPGPIASKIRVVSIGKPNFAHDINPQTFDLMSELCADEFHHHPRELCVLAFIDLR